jgi:2,4-dienoyl-CoA reductase-like NADH-dependent reductase (Old Yellow Enzyme family)
MRVVRFLGVDWSELAQPLSPCSGTRTVDLKGHGACRSGRWHFMQGQVTVVYSLKTMTPKAPTADTTTLSVEPLFRPFRLGSRELNNRIVMAPMTRSHSPGKVPGSDVATYYRRRAEGGTALIITEGTNPDHPASSGYPNVPGFYGDTGLTGWKRVVDEVHAAGAAIIPQLWHCGSIRAKGMEPDPTVPGFAPSAVRHPAQREAVDVPHEMTQADIDETIASFVRSAVSARKLGFDGVELHGAHSYLIDQFFWDATNQRTDKYGGSFTNRLTFAVELVRAVRVAVGPEFPIGFRFSQWKQGDYDYKLAKTPGDLERFLMPLATAGINLFHASTRRFNDPEFAGSDLNLAGWTKKITGLPTIAVGSVGLDSDFLQSYGGQKVHTVGIDALIRRLERDEFDLVAVGRALLSDPAWARKLHEGREDEIVPFESKHLSLFE